MGSQQSCHRASQGDVEPKQARKNKVKRQIISEEDLKTYTGMNRNQFDAWSASTPGVGKNQLAGKLALGSAGGITGMAIAGGFGGWGRSAEPMDDNRGMKFPPVQK
ncbi:hypothetical protein DCS_08265 [Drechmeria coniospora]|uniref:Uncharacterized protein n=1 Tax=Drechmeria coniospora TaxID=98403 RepID=A0A151GGS7_DRECN|nr:hypothetical protein DCS_08265 [Drechmeria coniospora]KYK56295.1 hypothetical protein DCS_08265 [Drechmeria coniospora]